MVSDIGLGLVNGLLVAIPLWVIIGAAAAAVFGLGPMEEAGSAALMVAAVCETLLLRPYLRIFRARFRRYLDFLGVDAGRDADWRQAGWAKRSPGNSVRSNRALEDVSGRRFESIEDLLRYVEPKSAQSKEARLAIAPQALLRQSLALSALVGAYLQYYFLEVNLQIASLHSVTIFVLLPSMT